MLSGYYTKLSIIALGETGAGKSLFCKLFSKSSDFFSLRSRNSVTNEVISRTFRNDEKMVEIELIDTPGFMDTREEENREEINLNLIKNFLSESNQRINCVIIVMDSRFERFPNAIKIIIKSICRLFPLPDFWNHVIIFWTHWSFPGPEEEEEKKNFINTQILDSFRELSQEIFNELRINPIQNNLKMIFNEYNETTTNNIIINKNRIHSEQNFNTIIDLVKNMTPIYKNILPPENKIELQEPRNGKIIQNYIQYKYNKIMIRKYIDFHNEDIIERPEILFTFYVHEFESDWEICEQESNETVKKYKIYKKRIFFDENNNEFIPEDDINIPQMEIKREKTVKKMTIEKPVEDNLKRKKIFEYDEVNYLDINEIKNENEKLIKEIEEGETEWRCDTNFNVPNTKRNIKYKTITEYDSNGHVINTRETNEEIDWEKIETKIENNIPQIVDENITHYYTRTTILKTSKNNLNPVEIPGGSFIISRTEQFKDEYDEPVKNLDENHIGEIKYNCYRVKYINNIRQITPRTLIPNKSYTLKYEKDNVPKTKYETRNGKDYEIKYNLIYMIDSRDSSNKNPTNFFVNINEQEINIITETDVKETILGNKVTHQSYKVYYKYNQNREKVFVKEEPYGPPNTNEIELDNEYFIIQSPMSLEKINQMRSQKSYPIIYNKIYYRNEKNTFRKFKIEIGKIEKIELKLGKHETKEISEDNKFITFKTEYKEIMFINNEKKENYESEVIDTINKTYDLIIKNEEEETFEDDQVVHQKYKSFYYYSDGKEILEHKEKDGSPDKKRIDYGDEYFIKEFYNYNETLNPLKKSPNKAKFEGRKINEKFLYENNDKCNYYNYEGINKNIEIIDNDKNHFMNNYYPGYCSERCQTQILNLEIDKKKEEEKNQLNNNKYPILYKKIYYHDEINTTRKAKVKTGKVEDVEIKLEHIVNNIESKDKMHIKKEEYDIEVTYINGKLDNKDEKNKINYKETNIYKYEEKVEKGVIERWWRADEHYFDVNKITKIITPDGKVETNIALKKSIVEKYNEKP